MVLLVVCIDSHQILCLTCICGKFFRLPRDGVKSCYKKFSIVFIKLVIFNRFNNKKYKKFKQSKATQTDFCSFYELHPLSYTREFLELDERSSPMSNPSDRTPNTDGIANSHNSNSPTISTTMNESSSSSSSSYKVNFILLTVNKKIISRN